MKKKIIFLLSFCFVFIFVFSIINSVFAVDTASAVKQAMSGLKNPDSNPSIGNKVGPIINTAIGFIQITGTGIAVIMVTILGIKYMLAAPGEKAETKKQITPLAIGAFILFASVNLVQFIANFASTLPKA